MTSIFKHQSIPLIPVSDEQIAPQQSNQEAAVRERATAEEFSSDDGQIARLAYSFWQERGCPIGSPEQDWFLAEQAIQLYKLRKEVGRKSGPLAGEQAMSKSA